ncbi:unnamed protein product [Lactuca virosa]|uniref:Uncharacterized protein n=1 Tax=Lactuca virosa TaxID=75947 RepID=A0AAU9MCQ8_9ASTR|nr:unnamed protein product [Lactuca virosa]
MDTWMVAVAAGAGYIAQHFRKCKQTGEQITSESPSFNSSFNDKPNSPKYPPERPNSPKWPFRRSTKKQDDSKVKSKVSQGVSTTEATSTSVNGVISGNCEGNSVFSSSTTFPCFVGSDNRVSEVNMGTPRNRMLLRNRRAIKPLTSLESCVMAQLHTPFASPSSKTTRPFLVTDGNKVINRSSGGTFIGSSEIKQNDSDAMLHVCIGMSFGILYSFMANRREVEKLNRLLKQTESLVQDLEEEIEMKDSLVMQELTIDDHKSQRTDNGYNNLEELTDSNNKESVIQKKKDESFGEIEAELEAELEMLELNMTSSTLERRISDFFEVDPDFEPDVAQGELRADMVMDNRNEDESGSRSTTGSPPCANYAVSPRELSLRLHELLQWQLEERIRELEAEIESKNTQNHKSWKDLSSSDENPNPDTVDVDVDVDDEPVVLNLSGEALDAYNEACNEFAKFDDDSDEEEEEEDEDVGTPIINGGSQDDDDEDEMEKLLIKHIVEKARQGSPMVLNAQRALFSE